MSQTNTINLDDCWLYAGYVTAQGYGVISYKRPDGKWSSYLAYRIFYESEVGEIPPNHDLDHLCFNPLCINPKHLEPVTRSENSKRRWRKWVQGCCPHCGKSLGRELNSKAKSLNDTLK